MKHLFLWVWVVLSSIHLAHAQGPYSMEGRVTDGTNNLALEGASVRLAGTTSGTLTAKNGTFQLEGITQENITLIVSFIGYESFEQSYNYSGKNSLKVKIRLNPADKQLDLVEIEGEAEGQVGAYLQQKRAVNIKNILSAEQIQSFPDMNAAEAIQRVPGITLQRDQGEGRYVQLRGTPPELTNFNINGEQIPSPEGNVRYVGMDIINVDQIETIEVTKVLTPDMDGDGIGGNVNIITKKAKAGKPQIQASIAGGYNNLRGTPNYQAQFSFGQRTGKFGFALTSSYYLNEQGSDNLEYKYVKGPFFGSQNLGVDNYQVQYREFQLRHYDLTRTRLGIAPTWDYKFNENSYIYLRGMFNRFTDNEIRRRQIYDLEDALSATYYLYGGLNHEVRERLKIQDVATANLGGEHKIGGLFVDYMLAYAIAREEVPNYLQSIFDSPGQAITVSIDRENPDWPVPRYPKEIDSLNAVNFGQYEMDGLELGESLVVDQNISMRANFRIPYTLNENHSGYFKFGGKMRFREKERDIRAQVFGAYRQESRLYPGLGPELSLITVDDGFRANNLLDRGYIMQYMPSPQLLRDFYEENPQYFIFNKTNTLVTSFGEDYTAFEDIYAAYGMFRHDWKNLMILGGLRYERTDIEYQGNRIIQERGIYRDREPLTDIRRHEFLLPQLQTRYALDNNTNLRAAITYTFARPNFEDILPYREEDLDEVRFGNPDLEFPKSLNIDVLAERYLLGGGILQGGAFYKQITDFVFFFKRFAHEGNPQDYGIVEITKAINGNQADVYGLELQSQFNFTFLPGFLSNFGLYANYTFTESEALINERIPANYSDAIVVFGDDDLSVFNSSDSQEKITLPGQAKHTTNIGLLYTSKKFYSRLIANYNDAFLFQLGADKDLDEYYDEAWRLDFTANYAVTPNFKIFVDVINLTNTPLKFYLGTPDQVQQQEFYSWWGRLGVKLNF